MLVRSRKSKAASIPDNDPEISDSAPFPQSYTSLLSSSKTFKATLLQYLSQKLIERTYPLTPLHPVSVVLDSPAFGSPCVIQTGSIHTLPANEHGEADYAVWYHAINAPSHAILTPGYTV